MTLKKINNFIVSVDVNAYFCACVLFKGCSRGPSPLTMGAQDTLPVAAAFTETVNAFFKGADPSKYVKATRLQHAKNIVFGQHLISF